MVSIQKGLPKELVPSAAELFLSALADKLVPILGDGLKATRLVESSIAISSCFSASEDNKLLNGLCTRKDVEITFQNEVGSLELLRSR